MIWQEFKSLPLDLKAVIGLLCFFAIISLVPVLGGVVLLSLGEETTLAVLAIISSVFVIGICSGLAWGLIKRKKRAWQATYALTIIFVVILTIEVGMYVFMLLSMPEAAAEFHAEGIDRIIDLIMGVAVIYVLRKPTTKEIFN